MWPLACNGNKDVNKTGMVYALLKFNIYLVWERDTTLLITYIYMCTKISIMIKNGMGRRAQWWEMSEVSSFILREKKHANISILEKEETSQVMVS